VSRQSRRALLYTTGAVALTAGAAGVLARRRAAEGPDGVNTVAERVPEKISPDTAGHRGGSGTPLLLLHGISVTWRSWRPVLPLLEAHHDVIAPTLLGHSGAAPLADGVAPSLEALVDGVCAELDTLGLDKVHVAGNSLGGWVALELARRGRARSVTVFSPAGAWSANWRMAALAGGMRIGLEMLEAFGERAERLAWTPRGRKVLAAAQTAHPERIDPVDLVADIRAVGNSPILQPLLGVLTDAQIEPLPDPGCPVRIVWARQDKVIPFSQFGRPMLERVPTAELVMLDDVGHVPMSDDPEAVAGQILEVTGALDRVG
jgi:pimeloyl-ACP methyl ester carboxylesterase